MSWITKLVKLVRDVFDEKAADLHTHLPARCVSFDATSNTCSIQLCVKRIRADDPNNLTYVELPIIRDVPVHQFGSGDVWLTVAPQVDAYGSYHVSERSISRWIKEGGVTEPESFRKFDISDGVFIPGLLPTATESHGKLDTAISTDRIGLRTRNGDAQISLLDDESMVLSNDDVTITIGATGNVTIDTDGNVEVQLNPAKTFKVTSPSGTNFQVTGAASA